MLWSAQLALAAHVATNVTVEAAKPTISTLEPMSRTAYVHPGDPWIEETDSGTFCATSDVRLVVDLVHGTGDLLTAQQWLADRLVELWGAGEVEVAPGCSIVPVSATPPAITRSQSGIEHLFTQVTYSPFRWESE